MSLLKTSILLAVFVLSIFLIKYETANAFFSLFSKNKVLEVKVVEKTLESEIDRLSIKYKVSSSTISNIIRCESQMYISAVNLNYRKKTTIEKDGSTTTSLVHWSSDWGPLQINDFWHEEEMSILGLDIHNEWDSLEYGFMLMQKQGLAPWSASKTCWSKKNKIKL